MSLEQTGLLLAWLAIVVLAFAMAGLSRQMQAAQLPQAGSASDTSVSIGPAIGTRPRLTLPGGVVWAEPTLLLFLDAQCVSCAALHAELGSLAEAHADVQIVAIYPKEVPTASTGPVAFLREGLDLFDEFSVVATPFGVVTDASGVVISRAPVASRERVEDLIASVERA